MSKTGCIKIIAVLMAGLAAHSAHAGGLSTQLGEAVVENLQIGQTYNLTRLANLNLIVTNTSDFAVDLRMDVLLPSGSEMREGAEPIPDTSWVKLSRNLFTLGPNEKAKADIIISIPDDDGLLGRKYQVMIWSHTLGSGAGMFLAYGLKTRLIFTIDSVRASQDFVAMSSNADISFTLKPEEIFVDNVEPGEVFDVESRTGLVLKITNPGEHPQTFRLKSRSVENSLAKLTDDYEDTPDASYLRFSEDEFVLAPGEIKPVNVYLEFPADRRYAGKKYMFVIHAYSVGETVTTGVYSRLYAAIE
jgi:hypothetical protein